MREQILCLIIRLLDTYGQEVAVVKDVTSQVCNLLSDPQSSIRGLVIDTLSRLYLIFGEVLMVELGSNTKIKPNHIVSIKEKAKYMNQRLEISIPLNRVDCGLGGTYSSLSPQSSPGSSVGNGSTGGSIRKPIVAKAKSETAHRAVGLNSTGRGNSLNSKDRFSTTTGFAPSFIRSTSNNSGTSGDSVKDTTSFSPSWYLSLLSESKTTQTIYPSSEKDLVKAFNGIISEIKKENDWQARVAGMGKLQALVTGICFATTEGDTSLIISFVRQIKSTPVSDLVCFFVYYHKVY